MGYFDIRSGSLKGGVCIFVALALLATSTPALGRNPSWKEDSSGHGSDLPVDMREVPLMLLNLSSSYDYPSPCLGTVVLLYVNKFAMMSEHFFSGR